MQKKTMNISTNINNYKYNTYKRNEQKQPSFGSVGELASQGLRYLNVNEAIGATLVDFFSMALPRTIVDSTRGFDAGVETGIRENSGTVNHVMIGTIGGAAAYALSPKFNKDYNVLSHTIFANNETIDMLGRIWHENFQTYKTEKFASAHEAFYKKAFEELEGLHSTDGTNATWNKLSKETIDELTTSLVKLQENKNLKDGKRIPKETMEYLKNLIISDIGSERSLKLISPDKTKAVEFTATSFLEDLFALSKAFSTETVKKTFEQASNNFDANTFIKELKGLKMRSTFLALGISSAIGASVQPFNRWLTKKRTGSDGFVGVANNPNVENKKADGSSKFMSAKLAAAASIMALALGSISTNIKEIPNKLQFKGKIPILSHFKLVYGFTIASRFLAARSSDELREACIKDFLGFTNWLILGGFVSKGVATMLDGKNLLNSTSTGEAKGFLNWLKNKSLKTVDEVLQKDLIKNGIKTVEGEKAISYKGLIKLANQHQMTDTLKKIKYLNIAQAAGYLYSGVVLGYLLPKLNIYMTERNNRKKDQNIQTKQQTQALNIKTEKINNPVFANFIK